MARNKTGETELCQRCGLASEVGWMHACEIALLRAMVNRAMLKELQK